MASTRTLETDLTSPDTQIVRLQVLGPIAVTREPETNRLLLTQPKPLAVLAYLTLARPRGLHSRDTLTALLWPESDQSTGRHALRNVLHTIRHNLGSEVITSAGDAMVGVSSEHIACDALEMESDLAAGNPDAAIARYHGDLLAGFHVSDAPEFERWVESERGRLRDALVAGSWLVIDAKRLAGDTAGSLAIARRLTASVPNDEISLRRMLVFLDSVGDRYGAVRAYDEFAQRLKDEYGAEPATETQEIARMLRDRPAIQRAVAAQAGERADATPRSATSIQGSRAASANEQSQKTPRTRHAWIAALLVSAVILTIAAVTGIYRQKNPSPAPAPEKLVVLPMDNETGDTTLAYVGTGLADGIARRLEGIGGIVVRSGARSQWPAATRHDFNTIARRFGSVILLKTTLALRGDSLEVTASVLDRASSTERPVTSIRFTTNGLRDAESVLAAAIAGTVFRVPLPDAPRASTHPVDPESYRLTLEGWDRVLRLNDRKNGKRLFMAAIEADPGNARAWSGLASALVVPGDGRVVGESLDEQETAAAHALALDSLEGTSLATVGFVRALRYRNLADGLPWLKKAIAADPSNAEIFLILSSLYRHAWMWDEGIDALRISEHLDPLSQIWVEREASVELCAGRPERALPLFLRAMSMAPSDTAARAGATTSLALLGRYDEAIEQSRELSKLTGDTVLAAAFARARGREGYIAARHLEGRKRLAKLLADSKTKKVAPLYIMQAKFKSGDADGGFAALEALRRDSSIALYRLPCMSDLDEVRGTPRYNAALRAIGPLPQR